MRAYPKELRSRVVAAVEQGEQTSGDLAGVFSVGLTFVKKMLRLPRAGEDLVPRHGGGSTPRWQDPDGTLAELPALLVAHGSRTVSKPTLCRAVQQLKLPRKKKVWSPRSATNSNGRNFGGS